MRRKLEYSRDNMTDTIDRATLPAGDYHAHSEGGKFFIGDEKWITLARIGTLATDVDFHLDKQTRLNLQAQDGTTCRNIAIESKPAYDAFVSGGGFRASSPRRPRPTDALKAGGRR
jgi:hypothetical protein